MASAAQDVQPSEGVDDPEIERTIAQLPASVIERQKADRLAAEDLADINRVALPFDLAVVAHPAPHLRAAHGIGELLALNARLRPGADPRREAP